MHDSQEEVCHRRPRGCFLDATLFHMFYETARRDTWNFPGMETTRR